MSPIKRIISSKIIILAMVLIFSLFAVSITIIAQEEETALSSYEVIQQENLSQLSTLHTLRHPGGAWNVAFSPNSSILATTGRDSTVRLWDVETGEASHVLYGHTSWVIGVAFSPDGRLIATGESGSSAESRHTVHAKLRIWDVETGELLNTFEGHQAGIWSVLFNSDGDRLVTSSFDGTVRIWDVETGEILHTLNRSGVVLYATFSPDGQLVISGGSDRNIYIWDTGTGELIDTLRGHRATVGFLDFSPDGQLLASAGDDSTVRLWDMENRELITTLEHDDWMNSAVFSPDGNLLATGGREQDVMIWNVENGDLLQQFSGHNHYILRMAFSPDGRLLASASWDSTIRVWSIVAD